LDTFVPSFFDAVGGEVGFFGMVCLCGIWGLYYEMTTKHKSG